MIDWHSHILPCMDDGSGSTAESISLIGMQVSQGIDTVIATPHFYANDETAEAFLERRKQALQELQKAFPLCPAKIIPGAEVMYYMGIGRLPSLESLKIEGSRLLLLEMPVSVWTESTVRELIEMAGRGNMQIVLAHIERYFSYQKPGVWERLLESGILMQANASFFNSFASKAKALSLLKRGYIHLLGSDCHSTSFRPPQIGKAYNSIQKKFGDNFLYQMNEYGHSLFK